MRVIYIRTSTEEQNPKNQLRDCENICNGEYVLYEEKQSAFKDKDRPIFEKIKKSIQKGDIKELYCWDLDRLYRDRKKLIGFFEYCKTYECKIFSFRQKFLNEMQNLKLPEGFEWIGEIQMNNFLHFLGWIAEDESRKKSDRVKIAFQNSKNKDKWGRPRKINDKLQKQVLDLYMQGLSIREIASSVWFWDKNNNQKFISKSAVHKIISKNK